MSTGDDGAVMMDAIPPPSMTLPPAAIPISLDNVISQAPSMMTDSMLDSPTISIEVLTEPDVDTSDDDGTISTVTRAADEPVAVAFTAVQDDTNDENAIDSDSSNEIQPRSGVGSGENWNSERNAPFPSFGGRPDRFPEHRGRDRFDGYGSPTRDFRHPNDLFRRRDDYGYGRGYDGGRANGRDYDYRPRPQYDGYGGDRFGGDRFGGDRFRGQFKSGFGGGFNSFNGRGDFRGDRGYGYDNRQLRGYEAAHARRYNGPYNGYGY